MFLYNPDYLLAPLKYAKKKHSLLKLSNGKTGVVNLSKTFYETKASTKYNKILRNIEKSRFINKLGK